jgi:antitoxin MazE
MKAEIVTIGNSKVMKIPEGIVKKLNLEDEVELEIKQDSVVIKPIKRKVREGWDKAFTLMHERKDDTLVIDETIESDFEDWQWK